MSRKKKNYLASVILVFVLLLIYWEYALFILAAIILVVVILAVRRIFNNHNIVTSGIVKVDNMSGMEFEHYLSLFFRKKGYQVRRTKTSGDFGADLLLSNAHEMVVVQVKRYSRNVGVKAIQEAIAAKAYYNSNRAMVVTNSVFTSATKEMANVANVEIWDRTRLMSEMSRIG